MTYDDLIRYMDKSVREELDKDSDGDPIFWALLSAVVFYTDSWRGASDPSPLADAAGIAITDEFVLAVLEEHCGESGDFESWRKAHPPT